MTTTKVETGVFRGSLVYTPSASTRFVLTGNYERDNNTPSNFLLKNGPSFPAVQIDPKGWVNRQLSGLSLTANHEFERLQFTSVSAVNRYNFKNLTNNSEALTFSKMFSMPASSFIPATDWSTYDESKTVSIRNCASVALITQIGFGLAASTICITAIS